MREFQRDEGWWRQQLNSESYRVLREKGTERPFTGAYWSTAEPGSYHCRGCDQLLFHSEAKFDAGCGWPSFYEAALEEVIEEEADFSFGMRRVEVLCRKCGGHLGHVFPDGPPPTGQRYCLNSVAMVFQENA